MLSSDQQAELKQALDDKFQLASGSGSWSLETVSASFGKQVISSSLKAVALALVLILIYVTFRFQWKFAIGAISAEIHDLLIVVGVYALTGREVTTATIAAVLTILGYSLYDTVIIYDRIRENEPRFNRIPYGDMVNLSIWETLTRSINTSLITLLPVVCLLLFGGSTLQDFAFALLVGILSGAYSSIFIASPVLTRAQGARAAVQEAQGAGSRRPGLTASSRRRAGANPQVPPQTVSSGAGVAAASFSLAQSVTREPLEPPGPTLYFARPRT